MGKAATEVQVDTSAIKEKESQPMSVDQTESAKVESNDEVIAVEIELDNPDHIFPF